MGLSLPVAGIEEDLACTGGGDNTPKGQFTASFGCLSVFDALVSPLLDWLCFRKVALGIVDLHASPGCSLEASETDFRDNTIHCLSWGRALALLITYIIRAGIASVLLVAGILWLARTTSIEELMLNSVALNAILDVDEFLFEGMTPIKIQHALRSVEPISVKYSHRRSQVESMVHFLAVLATVLASYLFLLVPLCETMMTVKRELCDGQRDFVVAYNTETQVSWGLRTEDLAFSRPLLSFRLVLEGAQ